MTLWNQALLYKITIHPDPSVQGPALTQDLETNVLTPTHW